MFQNIKNSFATIFIIQKLITVTNLQGHNVGVNESDVFGDLYGAVIDIRAAVPGVKLQDFQGPLSSCERLLKFAALLGKRTSRPNEEQERLQ